MKVRTSGDDSSTFEIRSEVWQGCYLSAYIFNYIIDWIFWPKLQDYPLIQIGADVHVLSLAYADEIVFMSSSYREMQGLLEAVKRHAAIVGMRINAPKTKVMSALIPGEQHQDILLDGKPLEDVDTVKFVANSQDTEETRSRIFSPAT